MDCWKDTDGTRGTMKLIELSSRVTLFDRLDYVSVVHNEHVFVLGVEYLLHLSLFYKVLQITY